MFLKEAQEFSFSSVFTNSGTLVSSNLDDKRLFHVRTLLLTLFLYFHVMVRREKVPLCKKQLLTEKALLFLKRKNCPLSIYRWAILHESLFCYLFYILVELGLTNLC